MVLCVFWLNLDSFQRDYTKVISSVLPIRRHLVQECQALGAQHTSQCAFDAALWRKLTRHPTINTSKIAYAV